MFEERNLFLIFLTMQYFFSEILKDFISAYTVSPICYFQLELVSTAAHTVLFVHMSVSYLSECSVGPPLNGSQFVYDHVET